MLFPFVERQRGNVKYHTYIVAVLTCVSACMLVCACVHACVHTYVCVCVCVCVHVRVCVCMCHYDLTRGRSGRGGCLAPGSLLCSESPQPSEIHSGLEETVVGSKVRVHLVQSAHAHIHVHMHAYTHTGLAGGGARGNKGISGRQQELE